MAKDFEIKRAINQGYPGLKDLRLTMPVAKNIIFWMLVGWMLVGGVFLDLQYTPFLVTLDVGLVVLFFLHATVIGPLMTRGVIPAYYRDEYRTDFMFRLAYMRHLLAFGGFVRLMMLLFMLSVVSDDMAMDWAKRTEGAPGVWLAVVIYLLYLFIMHYQERQIHVKSFIESVAIRQRNMHMAQAAESVRQELLRRPIQRKEPKQRPVANANTQEATPTAPAPAKPETKPQTPPEKPHNPLPMMTFKVKPKEVVEEVTEKEVEEKPLLEPVRRRVRKPKKD